MKIRHGPAAVTGSFRRYTTDDFWEGVENDELESEDLLILITGFPASDGTCFIYDCMCSLYSSACDSMVR